jgi:branched-chain amino acid transport system substrate-binding protein
MRRVIIRAVAALAGGLLLVGTAWAQPKAAGSGQVVKIAFMDPLSGPFAAVGQNQLKHFQYVAEIVNSKQLAGPGVRFEVVGFDNKNSPQESITLLRTIIDQGIRYVTQGNGSHVGIPLSDAISGPDQRQVLVLALPL